MQARNSRALSYVLELGVKYFIFFGVYEQYDQMYLVRKSAPLTSKLNVVLLSQLRLLRFI